MLAIICQATASFSQKEPVFVIRPLTVGDTIPDIAFSDIINYHSRTARLSDFRGKLTILDMWSTWCTSCIAAFPKMQKLQDRFSDTIQILLVNPYDSIYDSDKKIKAILSKFKERTGISFTMPVPVHDTILNYFFPHASVPHIVLIDKNGIVIGITNPGFLTEENINSILAGKKTHVPTKNDWAYDRATPLFVNGNGGDGNNFLYRSIISSNKEGIGSYFGSTVEPNGKSSRYSAINCPLWTMFQIAYPEILKYPSNRTFLELKDPSDFKISESNPAKPDNSYCYELIAPRVSVERMMEYMKEDLARNFNAIAKNEHRIITCYLLKTNANIHKSIAKSGLAEKDVEKISLKKFIHNMPVTFLTELLNSIFVHPVIDETGLKENINIDLPFDIYSYDLKKWQALLSKNGFSLTETKRKLEVAVITDSY
ncbi:MAG: Thiol-disulfide isomerase or thioredoxin [Chitinophagaceae bacterium]|nr:Thiol-disulfide isomerase or thioredoxin [Chitinophagaceae bacterium]